ncbi:PAS domain-containing protein [Marivirga arenosa]|uniref:histidine kinase n=1 Tax=Marivirga arenosa TaxID=3059076 RepID=A0AA51ZXB4_9BACT|nr:PAS domain-containing protein [Marivirga sp. BKB1-2]WNB18436.1 PAS domain-containing protein [Marivirga sp. BKB1-2]
MKNRDLHTSIRTIDEKLNKASQQLAETQSELKEITDKYRTLFENLGDEVHLWKVIRDENDEIETWVLDDANPAALKAWGKTKEEVVGKLANEIFGYDATSQFLPIIKQIFQNRETYKWEEYFPPTNQYLSMNTIPLGEYFISTGEDITERKLAEEALIKSEQKYRNIADNLPGVVLRYKLNSDGTDELEFVSKGIYDLYEITQEQALENNQLLWDRVHEDDRQAYIDSIRESAKNLSHWSFEHRIQLADGRIKWVHLNGIPTRQKGGSIIWDSVGLDITENKNSKEQLELLNNTLEKRVEERTREILKMSEELELYRLAAEHSKSGVWYYDLIKNELKWDDIMYQLYGINKDDFNGAFDAWEKSLHPEDKQRSVDELNEAINGKKPFDTLFRIVQSKTGKISHIRAKGKTEFDQNGKAVAVYGTNWDVSREMLLSDERKRALDELREMQSQLVLSEKMASIGVLTAGVAHEINNPLNYIVGGYLAIDKHLKNGKNPDQNEITQYLEWIKKGADRATGIVKSLNLLSRNSESKNEECEINTIIEDCILVLHHKHKDHIKITKDFEQPELIVYGNNGKLHQVVLNILSNAIDSITNYGELRIQTKSLKNQIQIKVSDNGCGIAKENYKKITDPFFTTKPPGKGTGLGLSICKSIINEHNGDLSFESELNKGTIFTISFPKGKRNERKA